MTNEQRVIQYVIGKLKPITTNVNVLQTISRLTFELEVLDKFLSALPSYAKDVAFDVICGKEAPKEEGGTE